MQHCHADPSVVESARCQYIFLLRGFDLEVPRASVSLWEENWLDYSIGNKLSQILLMRHGLYEITFQVLY